MDKISRIKYLVAELNQASALYYNGKQSKLSDKEWDSMFDELKNLESETNFILNNSPTQKVGYEVVDALEKVQHTKRMLSLDKTKDVNELKKFLGMREGVLSWKEDGLTIVLTYNNGMLIDAVTRGGGDIGSRILHNAKVFKNIPQKISHKGTLIIRGEGLISKQDFEVINSTGEYANPRNLASGSIMQLDSNIAKQRHLQFKAFGIVECDLKFGRYTQQLSFLENLGFDVVEHVTVKQDTLEIIVNDFKKQINDYEFTTDGLVLMYNDLEFGAGLGQTSHHENNAIAFKWQDSSKETTLRDIQFQVGRTGVLTPVALFDEIEIESSIVEKASLHNLSILKSLELGIGDKITVYKANMIIPQIDENLTRSNTFKLPTECPCCKGKVEIKTSEQAEFLYCSNPECNAKVSQKIRHYCSKSAMDIDGFSIKSIEKFIDKGFIKDVSDIYNLEQHKKEIVSMDGFGLKSYNNLIASINNSKKCNLSNFLYAIGIPNCGVSTCKELANKFKTIHNFINAKDTEIMEIKDIGDITCESILQYRLNNLDFILELLKYVEFIEEEKKEVTQGVFAGKSIYCTGSFACGKKDELKKMVEDNGGTFAGGYAKSLSYLVIGSLKGSSKQAKAEKDSVEILTEDQFLKMIGR